MNTKTIDWVLENEQNFEILLYKVLLFNKESEYYKFSGCVTAALLNHNDPDNKISILAIRTMDHWYTFKYKNEDLIKMFNKCISVIGSTENDSFTFKL